MATQRTPLPNPADWVQCSPAATESTPIPISNPRRQAVVRNVYAVTSVAKPTFTTGHEVPPGEPMFLRLASGESVWCMGEQANQEVYVG